MLARRRRPCASSSASLTTAFFLLLATASCLLAAIPTAASLPPPPLAPQPQPVFHTRNHRRRNDDRHLQHNFQLPLLRTSLAPSSSAFPTPAVATIESSIHKALDSIAEADVSFSIPHDDAQQRPRWNTTNGKPTRLIAHRGERAFSLPEHTLPAYHMAVWERADYIEPDLVLTKDGHLVIHHDLTLKTTTDISSHAEFASLKRNATILDPTHNGGDLYITNDWFIADLTLAQLRTLTLNLPTNGESSSSSSSYSSWSPSDDDETDISMRVPYFDHIFPIPTFQEYLDLVRNDSIRTGRGVGVVPELKYPSWHNERFGEAHYMEDKILRVLCQNGYLEKTGERYSVVNDGAVERGHLAVQSAEDGAARYLREKSDVYTVLLVFRNAEVLTPQGLDDAATFASALGIRKELYLVTASQLFQTLYNRSLSPHTAGRAHAFGGLLPPSALSSEIKKRGMEQMPFTFYSSYDQRMVGADPGDTRVARRARELAYFMQLGVDAMFVENVAEAVLVREVFGLCVGEQELGNGVGGEEVCGAGVGMEERRKELGAAWMWGRRWGGAA
ncbi:hypothetical protein HDU89_005210 [Geranomyces variabilis]|nr:hypothetical protein HDU89_005210 [Geranomyces variabilis]